MGKNRLGFSLVEMSIVLIIIGLMTAAVISYDKIRESSRLNRIISDLQQFGYAVNSFDTQYQALPGDMTNASTFFPNCTTVGVNNCNGNGNRKIGDTIGTGFENYRAWQHLALAKVFNGGFNGGVDLTQKIYPILSARVNGPTSTMGGVYVFANLARYDNFIFLRHEKAQGLLTPDELYKIDDKIDDGYATTGQIQGEPPPLVGADPTLCRDTTSKEYNFSNTSRSCILIYSLHCQQSCNAVNSYLYQLHD